MSASDIGEAFLNKATAREHKLGTKLREKGRRGGRRASGAVLYSPCSHRCWLIVSGDQSRLRHWSTVTARRRPEQLGLGMTASAHTTTECRPEGYRAEIDGDATSNHVQCRGEDIGRRKSAWNRSTVRIRPGGWGTSNTSNVFAHLSRMREVSSLFSLVTDGWGISLDVLDVEIQSGENRRYNRSLADSYVQCHSCYIGRDWTFKKGVAA